MKDRIYKTAATAQVLGDIGRVFAWWTDPDRSGELQRQLLRSGATILDYEEADTADGFRARARWLSSRRVEFTVEIQQHVFAHQYRLEAEIHHKRKFPSGDHDESTVHRQTVFKERTPALTVVDVMAEHRLINRRWYEYSELKSISSRVMKKELQRVASQCSSALKSGD